MTTLVEDCIFNSKNYGLQVRGSVTARRCVFNTPGDKYAVTGSIQSINAEEMAASVATLEDCVINSGVLIQPFATSTLRLVRCEITTSSLSNPTYIQTRAGTGLVELIDCVDNSIITPPSWPGGLIFAEQGNVKIQGCTFRGKYAQGAIKFGNATTQVTLNNNNFHGEDVPTPGTSHALYSYTIGGQARPSPDIFSGGGNLYRAAGFTSQYGSVNGILGGLPSYLWGVPATGYTLTGPASGAVGVASSAFTVTPVGGLFTGTVTPSDGGVGGSFSPASLSWSNTSDAKTFTYTPSTVGARTIATTNSNGLSNPAGVAYTGSPAPATGMSLTGPTTLLVGQTTAYTLKPDGVYTGSVTLSATGAGSFSPTSLSWSGESMARTVTFTASQRGSVTLTATPTGLPAPPSIMAQAIIRPTSYTMLAASTVIQSGQTATLTFGLPPGTDPDQDIVVTPTISDGAGTFSPTTVILGPTTMTATLIYLPMRGGPHTISAANDRGLADPPSVKLSVNSSSRPKGRGYVRRLRRV
jgi:hypothetical protein